IPAVSALGVPVSVDTYRAPVARAALEAGAVLINDYTGFCDPEIPRVAAALGGGVVCAHYRGRPRTNPSRSYDASLAEVAAPPAASPPAPWGRNRSCSTRASASASRRPATSR